MNDIDLSRYIRNIPDFPQPGVQFKDITTLLKDPHAYRVMIDRIVHSLGGRKIDMVIGPEARGFVLGAPLAYTLGAGFVPARKVGKLPYETVSHEYALEYGTGCLQIHTDAFQPGQSVLVADDLLATGGTAMAACRLAEGMGAQVVAVRFAIELVFLHGRDKLEGYDVASLVQYE